MVNEFLSSNHLNFEDVDLALIGRNGDSAHEAFFNEFESMYPAMP